MTSSLPASPARFSLRKLRDSHVEDFHQKLLLEVAEKRVVPFETIPQEEHQALRAEAVELANERVEFLRRHANVQTPAGNSAALRSTETSRPEEEAGAFIQVDSLPGNPALVTGPTALPQGIDCHQAVEPAAPLFSSSPFSPEVFFDTVQTDPTATMSYSDLFGQELTEEELQRLASLSPACLQHPQVLNDPAQLATQGQTQVLDRDMWPTIQDPFMGNNGFDNVKSSPIGVMQSSPLAQKSSNVFAQGEQYSPFTGSPQPSTHGGNMPPSSPPTAAFGQQEQDNMNVALDNNFIAQGDQYNFGTVSPAPTSQAGNMPTQSFPSGPAMADLNEIPGPNNNQASVPDYRNWPLDQAVDPWENNLPATDPEDAKARFVFHTQRLNYMHEVRKQTNEEYNMTYLLQGQHVVETSTAYIALQLGFNTANNIIGKYRATNDVRELLHLILHVRSKMMPKLCDAGPAKLRNCLYGFVRKVNDPQYKISCWNHVTAALFQMFCGIKGFTLMVDRHRENNPDHYNDFPAFKFETFFTVSRQEFWAWLAPARDDKELGDYDHWFRN